MSRTCGFSYAFFLAVLLLVSVIGISFFFSFSDLSFCRRVRSLSVSGFYKMLLITVPLFQFLAFYFHLKDSQIFLV